jgi:O-antigen ligase
MGADNRLVLSNIFLALFVFSIIVFSFQPGLTWIAQGCGLLVVFAFIFEVIRIKDFKFVMPMPLLLYLGFIMYVSISFIWTNQSVALMFTLIQLFFISFIMVNIITYQGHFKAITYSFLIALLVATIDMWIELGGLVSKDELTRVSSFLNNPNTFAMALSIGILLAMESLLKEAPEGRKSMGRAIHKLFLVLILLLFAYEILFITGSRKAMISLFFLGFMLFFRYLLKVNFLQKILIVIVASGVLVEVFILLKESVFFERLNRVFDMLSGKSVRDGSLTERSSMMSDARNLWEQKPLSGWGTDQFRYLADYQTYSHNNYLELLSNNGLLGLLLYYGIFVLLLIPASRMFFTKKEMHSHYGWFGITTLLIFVFWDLAHVSYYSKFHWMLLSIIIGMLCFVNRNPLSGQRKAAIH